MVLRLPMRRLPLRLHLVLPYSYTKTILEAIQVKAWKLGIHQAYDHTYLDEKMMVVVLDLMERDIGYPWIDDGVVASQDYFPS